MKLFKLFLQSFLIVTIIVTEFAQLLDTEKLGSHPIPLTLYFNSKGERVKQFAGD